MFSLIYIIIVYSFIVIFHNDNTQSFYIISFSILYYILSYLINWQNIMNLSQQLIPLNKSLMSNEHNIKYFEHDFDNIAFSYKMDNVIFVSVNKDLTKKYRPEEVEGILHHEIGHIELGHSKKILIIETLIVLTTLSLMTLSPYLFITYIPLYIFKMYVIRFHEYQADKYSMSKSYGLYNLFRRIRIIEVDSILNTHPTIKQRLKYIEQIITKDKK